MIAGTCGLTSEGKTGNIYKISGLFSLITHHTAEFLFRWRGPGFIGMDLGFVAIA